MNWISDTNKKIYASAMGALYEDIYNVSTTLVTKTTEVVSNGYNKLIAFPAIVKGDTTVNHISDISDGSDTIDTSDNNIIINSEYPDVLIRISKKKYINGIWLIIDNNKQKVTGKISSYPHISVIIHKWFRYNSVDDKYHWYPTLDLYTKYRESTPRELKVMDNILFKYDGTDYVPCSN